MDTEARAARIAEMEEAFDEAAAAVRAFEQGLDAFEAAQPAMARFAGYYGSAAWFDDRDADEAGELPEGLKRGVLGEDLGYELLVDYHDLAIRMLEAATRALKEV